MTGKNFLVDQNNGVTLWKLSGGCWCILETTCKRSTVLFRSGSLQSLMVPSWGQDWAFGVRQVKPLPCCRRVDIHHHGWEDARAFLPPLPLDMPLTSKTIICTMCPSLHACDQTMYIKYHMCYVSFRYLKSHFTTLDISPDIRCIFKTKYIWASFLPD